MEIKIQENMEAVPSLPSPMHARFKSVNYVEDVLRSMLNDQSDHVFSKFTDAYIKYRRVVVEWMIDVAEYFNLHITTTHAAIAYLDRLQPNDKYSRFEWQMMAICCLLISSKYNECEEHVPPLQKLEEITQQSLPNDCVLNYELWALKRMGWKLNARTPVAFIDAYMYLGRSFSGDVEVDDDLHCFSAPVFETTVNTLATKCMLDHSFKAFPASAVATAIVYFARETFNCSPLWSEHLTRITGHDAPTSKSVQKVLQLLDALTHDELMTKNGSDIGSSAENSPLTTPVKQLSSRGEEENNDPAAESSIDDSLEGDESKTSSDEGEGNELDDHLEAEDDLEGDKENAHRSSHHRHPTQQKKVMVVGGVHRTVQMTSTKMGQSVNMMKLAAVASVGQYASPDVIKVAPADEKTELSPVSIADF